MGLGREGEGACVGRGSGGVGAIYDGSGSGGGAGGASSSAVRAGAKAKAASTQKQYAMSAGIMKHINPFSDQMTSNGLPMAHAYSVLEFDATTDMLTIRNPWGSTELVDENGRVRDGRNDGTFQMSLSEFKSTFHMVTFEEPLT